MEENLVHTALHNIQTVANLEGHYMPAHEHDRGVDGKVDFVFDNGTETFFVEVKKQVRNHHLPQLLEYAERFKRLLVVADYIPPAVKEELRNHKVAYLETAGNIYLMTPKHYLWIEGQKPIERETKANRAFTPAGLKVVYFFLTDERAVYATFREIADKAGVALGNVNNVITGLKEKKFLIMQNNKQMKLMNEKQLLEKWIAAYEDKLKPTLHLGNYRFLKETDYEDWKTWQLNEGKTFWGGEPAGEIITDYLKPEIFTIYTDEPPIELVRKYRMVPDPEGAIRVYKKFWNTDLTYNTTVVHPLLAYTDLINVGDRRCRETAQKIYDEFLRNRFQ